MALRYPVKLDIFKLLVALSEAMDLVNRALVNHHRQVCYIAYCIGKELGLKRDELRHLAIAGALHDIGGLSLEDRLGILEFELNDPDHHAILGSLLLAKFQPLGGVADLVRHHHVYWHNGAGSQHLGQPVPAGSHILHLADRITVLIDKKEEILGQIHSITQQIADNSGRMFVPEQVDAFSQLSVRESFWFDVVSPAVCLIMSDEFNFGSMELQQEDLLELASFFGLVIDIRSKFTATHSSGVAVVAEALGGYLGMDKNQRTTLKIAGLLHDIGKLVVPKEILEKKISLNNQDFIFIRKHPYFTRRILHATGGFEPISDWAAFHHERIDGTGYPYHLKGHEISLEAKILAVVDTFTALTEDRPYRTGVSTRNTQHILEKMVSNGKLDAVIVTCLIENLSELNKIREIGQSEAFERHNQLMHELKLLHGDT